MTENSDDFSKDYSEEGFWKKGAEFAKLAGKEVVEKALQMYYALQDPNTPAWAKTVIVGALGYFISPVDAIPDIIPMVGFADDLGVLTAAVATVAISITDEVRKKADVKRKEWFGE